MSIDFPSICLGGDVFGWTADESGSHAVLDEAFAAGIRFVDTSDVYSAWAHDGVGGQSETIIGRWMADRGNRDDILLASKVGWLNLPFVGGIRPDTILRQIDRSLGRLQTDRLDLYYAHRDDGGDLVDTVAAFNTLIEQGKIRAYGLSNITGARLREALDICSRQGLTAPVALQPMYSLMERGYEEDARDVAREAGLAVNPYSSLASGFLTGKYRPGNEQIDSDRAGFARGYLQDPRGLPVLELLDAAAEAHGVPQASIALAWLRAQPTIVAPVSSARAVTHVAPLAASVGLELTQEEIDALEAASRPPETAVAA
jgi:aryl-alcohol dehydrogenase-like predicted oxidoreductase